MVDTESEKIRIQEFVDRGNYHAAMNIAISTMNECRRNDHQSGVDEFLAIIQSIAQTMENEFGSK